ncbi:hypothetical protein MKEN_00164400 [Mycena kentingensis (nom. inval.)]|nr:hypothetical protein MKEN_00164400 [Mycena kentingensis (nom. inval.)]
MIVETRPSPHILRRVSKIGYAAWVVLGAQRMVKGPPGTLRHLDTLDFILSRGVPPDVQSIEGYTALHHSLTAPNVRLDLARCLLKHGANVNLQDRYGSTPLLSVMLTNSSDSVEFLLENGADLDLPDADGVIGRKFYRQCGPKVSAVVTKWLRKEAGQEEAPRGDFGKKCADCGKKPDPGVDLKCCGRCKVARYCSPDCQKRAWPKHKARCRPFSTSTTVTLKPVYHGGLSANCSPSGLMRAALNVPGNAPDVFSPRNTRTSSVPKNVRKANAKPKTMVVKVQVPFSAFDDDREPDLDGDLLVYDKNRHFACTIRREDAPAGYDAVSEVIRGKTATRVKGYFAAELHGEHELVGKVGELLADQPW